MFVVGITGGIGSGKTAVTDHLERLGIVVVDADKAARVVVESGKPALDEMYIFYKKYIKLKAFIYICI